MLFTVKVKHRRFLNSQEAKKLQEFGIKVVLTNKIYDEHAAHMPSNVEFDNAKLEQLKASFNCSVADSTIQIDMGK